MFPSPSLQLAQQGALFIGFIGANADEEGNAGVPLPANAAVGDLVIVQAGGFVLSFGGTSGGSWTTALGSRLYYKRLVDLGTIGIAGYGAGFPYVAMVFRGPTAVGNVNGQIAGGTTVTLSGVSKSNGAQGLIAVVCANSENDGKSSYSMTSPANSVSLPRQSYPTATVASFYNLTPNNYVSGDTLTATGFGTASYNVSFVAELV